MTTMVNIPQHRKSASSLREQQLHSRRRINKRDLVDEPCYTRRDNFPRLATQPRRGCESVVEAAVSKFRPAQKN